MRRSGSSIELPLPLMFRFVITAGLL